VGFPTRYTSGTPQPDFDTVARYRASVECRYHLRVRIAVYVRVYFHYTVHIVEYTTAKYNQRTT